MYFQLQKMTHYGKSNRRRYDKGLLYNLKIFQPK